MGILAWLIFGGLAGWIASMIMSKDASMGVIANIVVGIIGAFLGGFITSQIGGWDISGFNLESLIVAVFGAIVLLAIVNLIQKGRAR
jgi:uncharacterized membrane protein YeaQ/YmgE (transglycosylase-associated protein family)